MTSTRNPRSASWPVIAWLVVGIIGGGLLGRSDGWLADGKNQRAGLDRSMPEAAGIPAETKPSRPKRSAPDGRVSVTPKQLSQLASGGATGLSLQTMVGLTNGFSFWGTMPEEKRDENLKAHLEDLCTLLAFNPEESAKLREILKVNVRKLIDMERASLPIREIRPGKLELDFDALAEDRKTIVGELRNQLREAFGERALQDLDILAGLDELAGPPGESQNVELSFERQPGGWKIWTITPGPGGREGGSTESQGSATYQEQVLSSLRLENGGRFVHLKDRLPADLTSPP